MKLSAMPTEHVMDIICDLLPYVEHVVKDEKLGEAFSKLASYKFDSIKSLAQKMIFTSQVLNELLPIVLRDHKNDVFGILALVNNSTPEAIKAQPLSATIMQIREAVMDEELIQLFSWQGRTGDATSSGSASVKAEET